MEAFRGIDEGQEENGRLDEVIDELVSKIAQVFLNPADEGRARQAALHRAIGDAVVSSVPP